MIHPASRQSMVTVFTLFGFLSIFAISMPSAQAEEAEPESKYAKKGAIEIGGNVGFNWDAHTFSAQIGPTLGYFVTDRWELSANLSYEYDRDSNNKSPEDSGVKTITRRGAFLVEPSYHLPVAPKLLVFGGVGVGAGYDTNDLDFELAPRVGLNIESGSSAVFTPALKIPILFDSQGTTVGLAIEIGVSGAF